MHLSPLRSLFARALALSLPVLAAGAYAVHAAADDQKPTPATIRVYQHLLARFDANHDGRLQVSELPAGVNERLGAADADRDGVITPAELHAFGVARRAARFARADRNGDGKLEPAEVAPARWEYLKVADANHDGAVTLVEIEQAIAAGTLRSTTADDDSHD
jgi:hypothetical protein